jgi:hypothetical protein
LTLSQKTFFEATTVQPAQRRRPFLLIFLCISECLYLLILALLPLPTLHMSNTPIPAAYPWTLIPTHILVALLGRSTLLAARWLPSALLFVTLVALLAAYVWILTVVQQREKELSGTEQQDKPRSNNRQSHSNKQAWPRPGLLILLAGALLFGLTLLFQAKLFSDDVFTYIFSGRILTVYGADPLNTAPYQYPLDSYLQWVIAGRSAPNIYGPLWLCISALLVSFKAPPAGTLLLFKGLALSMHLVNCVLVWAILGKIAPARRFLGTLLYAWNPLVLIELTGSGHSEGVLLFVLLLTTWVLVQGKARRWKTSLHILAYLLFGIAISVNLITLLIAPLAVWFDVRTRKCMTGLTWGCSWRTLLLLLPAMAISLPFWRGASTFFAITSAIDMGHFVHSPVGVFAFPLRAAFIGVADALHFPPTLQPITSADITLRATATLIFVLIYANLFSRVRHAPKTRATIHSRPDSDQQIQVPGFDILLSSWGIAVFWYMILVSGWFWPWYMLWMLWAVILRRLDAFTKTVLVLSGTSLLLYPLQSLVRGPVATYQPAVIFGIPLLYLIVVSWRQRKNEKQKERTQAAYE